MTTVEILHQNDPHTSNIHIVLRELEPSGDTVLSEALRQNEFVEILYLHFHDMGETSWNLLAREIATRDNLVKIRFFDHRERAQRASFDRIRPFFAAFQSITNNSLKIAGLFDIRIGSDLAILLDSAKTLTSLSLAGCDMEPTEREQGTRDLAAALQRHANLKTLELEDLEEVYMLPILQSLERNQSLRELCLGEEGQLVPLTVATCSAIKRLLENTKSIRIVKLKGRFSESCLRSIFQGASRSGSVTGIELMSFVLSGEESVLRLEDLLRLKPNLRSLKIGLRWSTDVEEDNSRKLLWKIVTLHLARPDCALRMLGVDSYWRNESGPRMLNALFRGVEKSNLESFSIGSILTHEDFTMLKDSIPAMRVKELEFCIGDSGGFFHHRKNELLCAVQRNFCLRTVKNSYLPNVFDDDDKQVLQHNADRNERLAEWGERPESVPACMRPVALKLAVEAGRENLFRALLLPIATQEVQKKFSVSAEVISGCSGKHGWDDAFSERVLIAYHQFMELKKRCKEYGDGVPSPSDLIDLLWKEYIENDRATYEDACLDYHGRVIERIEVAPAVRAERNGMTRELVKHRFPPQVVDLEIWGIRQSKKRPRTPQYEDGD